MNNVVLEKFCETDIEEMAPIMKRAFDYDSMIHLGTNGGPEGYNDGSFLRKWALNSKATALKIKVDDNIVGLINLFIKENNQNFLGCFFIDPSFEDKGLGTFVWEMVEKRFPETVVWRTETPGFSIRNHHFYVNKCHFKVVKIENPKDKMERSFLLEKYMKKW